MAPQTPRYSGRPGEAGTPLDDARYLREAVRAVFSLMPLAISWAPFLL